VGVNVRAQATTDKLERLAGLVISGRLRRPEITIVPLADAARALMEVSGAHVRGKLVLVP
jgi:NADPH:quinone reductase-like Zn-dependent oxidoreductase